MRVLFVYKTPSINIHDPLGLLYLISTAKLQKHECLLLLYDSEKNFKKKAIDFKPEIVCYSLTTGFEKEYLRINRELNKYLTFFSVFGGSHPTFYPELIEEEGVDCICRGEGEDAFSDLLHAMSSNREVYSIPNFWFKKNGQIVKNEIRNLNSNLDSIPFPDRDEINRYFRYSEYGKINIITGRGCPYNCTYCFNHVLKGYYKGKGKYIRKRSVDNVIAEINAFRSKYVLRDIYFVDDIFTIDKDWFSEFTTRYRKEVGLPYQCHLRANLVSEQIVEQLKESGCRYAGMAIESGNFQLRKDILRRNMTNDQIIRACDLLRKYDIDFGMGNMLGIPHETIENAFETIDLNVRCGVKYGWVSILQPYPNTEIYQFAKKNKLLKDSYSIEANYHNSTPFKSDYSKEFENLHNFFALAIGCPFLIPVIKRLISLPKNKGFKLVHNVYKLYRYIRIGQINLNIGFAKHILTIYYVKSVRFLRSLKKMYK